MQQSLYFQNLSITLLFRHLVHTFLLAMANFFNFYRQKRIVEPSTFTIYVGISNSRNRASFETSLPPGHLAVLLSSSDHP